MRIAGLVTAAGLATGASASAQQVYSFNPAGADLNHDGAVTAADLGILLGDWGLSAP